MTPRTVSPLAIALESGFRTRRPAPSPRQYPPAAASNALEDPFGFRKDAAERFWYRLGLVMTLTPPANATEHSSPRSACGLSLVYVVRKFRSASLPYKLYVLQRPMTNRLCQR